MHHSRPLLIVSLSAPTLDILEQFLDLFQVLSTVDLDDPVDLAGIAHQLLCTGVQHLHLAIACYGQVV